MPKLDTSLHVDMLKAGKRRRNIAFRVAKAVQVLFAPNSLYGYEWGDPDMIAPLGYVRDHFLLPWITPQTTLVEIGPGGGRWTQYMLAARKIHAVDYHQELLDELKENFPAPNIDFICNHGDDFPGIAPGSVDFVFSFGVFVHLDVDIIDRYLGNIRPLLKPDATVVIHYADKTKPLGRSNGSFSENDPERMRALVRAHGYVIQEEDVQSIWHSAIIRFGLPPL